MKRCYLVVGAESSGNRLLGKLLVSAGCTGDDRMDGPFSASLPTHEDPAVVIRSYPHGNEWPDLSDIYRALRNRGYQVRVIVAVRDRHCTVMSQVKSQHHPAELAQTNVQRAYLDIFQQLGAINCWYVIVPFESLVLHGEASSALLETLGLTPATVEIRDENGKHYGL